MSARRGWQTATLAILLVPSMAHAAELAWRSPAECDRGDVVRAQVEKLIGQELAGIEGISFQVEVSASENGAHHIVLQTLSQGSAPREREITGASCTEVADAVSVAIALTISEREQATEPAPPGEQERTGEQELEPPASEPKTQPAAALRFAIGAGLVVESGALPEPVPGFALAGALEWQVLRAGVGLAVFPPQDAHLPGDERGGTFDFMLGAIELCAKPPLDDLHLLACAGFELGRIGAQGDNVLDPREGASGWYAPRVELGVGYGVAEIVRLWLRAGAAVPLARPEFLLDDIGTVHQPSNVSLRALLGVEIVL